MVRKKGIIIGVSLLLVTAVIVGGIYVFNRMNSKKNSTPDIPFLTTAESKKPPVPVQNLNTVKEAYDQKDYESVIAKSKVIYENETEQLDFKMAALGYCVRSLQALGKDTKGCQAKADELLNPTTGPYRQFLLDTFNSKEVK